MPTITQDAPKRVRASKKEVPDPKDWIPLTEAQRQAKLEAYLALKSADIHIPAELADVEGWIADARAKADAEAKLHAEEAQKTAQRLTKVNETGPWYVRNGYTAPFGLRLQRQTDTRRIQLAPRGKPGDMHPLEEGDLKDPVLKRNLNLGVIEIIPAGEAEVVMQKQTTNIGHRVHTPLSILRSELNQPYQQGAVKVMAEFNQQGVTVAQIDPNIYQMNDKTLKQTGGLTQVQQGQQSQPAPQQATSVVSAFVPTGGNPTSVQMGTVDAHSQNVDALARRKDIQGPLAGLGDIQVTIDPVQKVTNA
jgi:hypothetical protein